MSTGTSRPRRTPSPGPWAEHGKGGCECGFIYDASNFRIRSRVDGRYWIQSSTTPEIGAGSSSTYVVSPVVVLH